MDPNGSWRWTVVVLAVAMPVLLVLGLVLWMTPYPLAEGVALVEDIASPVGPDFLLPTRAYYRPLFHLTLFTAWHSAGSVATFVAIVRLLHLVPVAALAILFVVHLRPKTPTDAAAAIVALTVLMGSPAFLDNIEIPLTYTIVGMAALIGSWVLWERQERRWHTWALVALALLAIGFKEQGLVIVPLLVVAWWTGAPGASRAATLSVTVLGGLYVALRLLYRGHWATFEQDIGYGFDYLSARDATARFGASPLGIYAYNGLSTMANVLFTEPQSGVFSITSAIVRGQAVPWQIVHLSSSVCLTGLIAWWGVAVARRDAVAGWARESRTIVVLIVALAASGVLSFNYSRDRLGGMALVPYAAASYFAVRAALARTVEATTVGRIVGVLALVLLASTWQVRTLRMLDGARKRVADNRKEWITDLHQRRTDYAGRADYLRAMEALAPQGTAPVGVRPLRYPRWALTLLGPS